jgi:hypothetical protein
VLLLWGGLYLVLGPLRSAGDGDLYWQRWLGDLLMQTHRLPVMLGGETFTAAGAPWVPQEWLFSAAVAVATDHRLFVLLAIFVSALPVAILATIYFRARGSASPEAIGAALLFCGIALLESFGVRAQVLGWAALAAFLFFLERRDRWQWAAIPTAIVWANLHASVAIAPVLVLARIAAIVAGRDWKALRTGREIPIFFGSGLAMLCTPLGWRLPEYAVALAGSPIRHFIQEWQPSGLGDSSFLYGALPLALAVAAGWRATLWDDRLRSFPAIVTFGAMLFASRNVPIFAIAAAPLAAIGLDLRVPRLRAIGPRVRELEPVAIAGISVAMLLSGIALVTMQRHSPDRLPIAAIASLDDGAGHRLLCENFTWCSMALGRPNVRVFIDGRCDPYPVGVWNDYIAAIRARASWHRQLGQYGVDTVVAGRGSRLAAALAADPAWKRTFQDRSYVVLRRD